MSMLIILIVFVGLMFFMTQQQKKQQKKQQELLNQIGPNDNVMTAGGIVGTVKSIKGDVFLIETENGGKIAVYRANVQKKLSNDEWETIHTPHTVNNTAIKSDAKKDENSTDIKDIKPIKSKKTPAKPKKKTTKKSPPKKK